MSDKSMNILEFNKILEMLCEKAISEAVKKKLSELQPYLSLREVSAKLNDTTEAVKILENIGTPPLPLMKDTMMLLEMANKGTMLTPEQLTSIALFITACSRMKLFLKRAEVLGTGIAGYGGSIVLIPALSSEIEKSIRNNMVDDNASKELKDIRRKIEHLGLEAKCKLEGLLRSKKEWFTESFVATRNGHYVLPVKKEFKNQISGSVLDISSSGTTYFIEPSVVMKLKDELTLLEIEESNEERRILYSLSAMVNENAAAIELNMDAMEALDFIFAKGKLSIDMKAVPAAVNNDRYIRIVNGRHPLIKPEECVPLNFTIGNGINGVVITGPNTGGKTVALKTVGLLQLMAQSGLHVPCESAELCMNNAVLCDIGDGQSITENLSTFSAHITNIIDILNHSDRESMVLLDELGSGTDPAEGMGIAISVLEELTEKGCLFVVTTHYPEVKEYANGKEGMINARMAFDRESLKPLYRLEIGEAGESCALYIAKRLGMPKHMLARAYKEAYLRKDPSQHKTVDSDFLETLGDQQGPEDISRENSSSVAPGHILEEKPKKEVSTRSQRFNIGDSVMVYPQKKIGIVYCTADEKGQVGVQIQGKKELIKHTRLQLKAPASQMYPEDYDFSIIFDTVANRKARHKMEKGYHPDLEIVYEKDAPQ